MAFGGKILSVSHTVALLITASFATIFDPFSVTPVARPFAPSTRHSRSLGRSAAGAAPFFPQAARRSLTIASEPPTREL